MKTITESRFLLLLSLLIMGVGQAFAQYEPGERYGSVTYIDSHWDEKTKQVVTETKTDWIAIRTWSTDRTTFGATGTETWYAIEGKRTEEAVMVNREGNVSSVDIYGEVHLILLDGAELAPLSGIRLEAPGKLHIHVQSNGDNQGRIIVKNPGTYPAIGARGGDFGELHIHGGYIDVTGGKRAAGIGTMGIEEGDFDPLDFNLHKMGKVYVYDGMVKVHGGDRGAGIGGGCGYNAKTPHSRFGVYTQYGGDVTVWGGETAAGMGGGGCYSEYLLNIMNPGGNGFEVNMYGGKLTAYGGRRAAGIGSGNGMVKIGMASGGKLYAYGGTVYAKGGDYGAGIGGGCNAYGTDAYIYGGTVTAIGGTDAAGLGGGESGKGGTVVVDGGTLRAEGNGNAAGIGGGENNDGWSFEYKKGDVISIAGGKCKAREKKGGSSIGCGKGNKFKCKMINTNIIKLATDCKVTAGDAENNIERTFTTQEREGACRWRNFVKLETCEHKEFTYAAAYLNESQHRKMCRYCNYMVNEDHTFPDGEHCVCGKTANKATDLWTVTVKQTTDGTTYTDGTTQYAVRGKSCILPQPADVEGLIFMGYMESATAPESLEMKDSEMSLLVDAEQIVTPSANTTYYARYRYDYSEDWTWSDDYESATVKISNSLTGDTQTITAHVEEDETERIEPEGNKLGMMTFRANAEYKHTNEATYQFGRMARVEYFNTAEVDLDAFASNNEEVLEAYTDQMSSVSISNMTLKKDGRLHPLCLPFSMTMEDMAKSPLAGATLFQLSSSERVGSQLQLSFKKVTDGGLAAGEPYYVKWASGSDIENPEFYGVLIKESTPWIATGDYFQLFGTFDMEAIADEYLMNGTFLGLSDEGKLEDVSNDVIDAFGNYLFIPDMKADDGSTAVCSVRISFEDDITVEKFITYGFEGEGTAEKPYIINNARQLSDMAAYFNAGDEAMQGKYFRQGANITFDKTQENNFTPIAEFNGHYDGAGFIISGLNINRSGTELKDEVAPFVTMAENSTLKNMIIANSTITGRTASALVNSLRKSVLIDNCHVLKDVAVRSNYYAAAGLVVYIYSGSAMLKNCTSQAMVTSNQSYAAGIVASMNDGTLTGCCYLGTNTNMAHGVGAYHANPIVAIRNGGTVTDCYYTAPTLSDNNAKLMPQFNKDVDNTDFLKRLHARDEFLLKAGLTKEQIGYDITMNNREKLAAVKQTDGTWKSKAYVVCLPFGLNFNEQLGTDPLTTLETVVAYRPHIIDLEKKQFVFTVCPPELVAGESFIVVVKQGEVALEGKNVTVVDAPGEPDKIMSATDGNRQIGWWKGTFSRIDNPQMTAENIYIAQSNGTYRCPPKGYTTAYVNPFVGYFSALEPLKDDRYTIKYVYTGQGDGDDDETGEVEDFPADEFDSDTDFDDPSGIKEMSDVTGRKEDGRRYNLSGQKVSEYYRGIIIRNGKKIVIN